MIADKVYFIPVSEGLLTPEHINKIGAALAVFLWCIQRTTKEVPAANPNEKDGLVYGGRPVRAAQISVELGIAQRTIHAHLKALVDGGYLRAIDFGLGMPSGYVVTKSKKWSRSSADDTPSQDSANPRQNQRTLAENGEPSQDSANPRENQHDLRRNQRGVRHFQRTYIATAKDSKKTQEQKPLVELASELRPDCYAEIVERVFGYYCERLQRDSRRYRLTETRQKKAISRLKERERMNGSLEMAEADLKIAVDNLAANPFNRERDYIDWNDHIFNSEDIFEKRLSWKGGGANGASNRNSGFNFENRAQQRTDSLIETGKRAIEAILGADSSGISGSEADYGERQGDPALRLQAS